MFLDFKKAFDKVPHIRLIRKMQALGINKSIIGWVREWLRGREQRVVLNGEYSEWIEVTSGVPQGSVLGPVLFIIYVNDLERDLVSALWKFADDAKLLARVNTVGDRNTAREDLTKLETWSKLWQMEFNTSKCKVMHLGKNNCKEVYKLDGVILDEVREERDLGIIISDNLKVGEQCAKAAKKGNQILGLISRTFVSRDKEVIVKLYKSLVRPHLEYCIQAWRPHLVKDIEILERVQRRATRMIGDCKGQSYEQRLVCLNLSTLEKRRFRADLIEVWRIVHGLEGISEEKFFVRALEGNPSTRGHSFKFFKNRFNTDLGKYSFKNRIITEWNLLPKEAVITEGINSFKRYVDKYLGLTRG
jgi:ribonuclease P/MRP protein subunit RPP40